MIYVLGRVRTLNDLDAVHSVLGFCFDADIMFALTRTYFCIDPTRPGAPLVEVLFRLEVSGVRLTL